MNKHTRGNPDANGAQRSGCRPGREGSAALSPSSCVGAAANLPEHKHVPVSPPRHSAGTRSPAHSQGHDRLGREPSLRGEDTTRLRAGASPAPRSSPTSSADERAAVLSETGNAAPLTEADAEPRVSPLRRERLFEAISERERFEMAGLRYDEVNA